MIKSHSIEELKSILDIVDVVGNYVQLKKSGSNYKGLCPFHSEKTPSFVVSQQKNIYHCFSCKAGGDPIKFTMEIENISYPEAIEKLANDYNFLLNYENSEINSIDFRVLEQINEYFIKELEKNKIAKDYLQSRGIYESSIEKFQIGYAPSSANLLNFINSKKIPVGLLIEQGVLANDDKSKIYSRFIERITFPIYNQTGKIVGFGGRTITNHPAKYINSPQSNIFNKSKLLYGYNFAKDSIRKKDQIIITEGYLDTIMLHQAGFSNSVATLGTALTTFHIPIIKKLNSKVILAYDGDKAGITAASKGANLLSSKNIDGGVVIFKDNLDPAEMVFRGEVDKLKQLFSNYKNFSIFIFEEIKKRFNTNTTEGKKQAFFEANEYLINLSEIDREDAIKKASQILNIDSNYFKNKKAVKKDNIFEKKDIAELQIIKTIHNNHNLLDLFLDLCDERVFNFHKDIYLNCINNQNDSTLLEITLDESIASLTEEELKNEIRILLIKTISNEIENIKNDQKITLTQKAFNIRQKQFYIKKLKNGEFVEL